MLLDAEGEERGRGGGVLLERLRWSEGVGRVWFGIGNEGRVWHIDILRQMDLSLSLSLLLSLILLSLSLSLYYAPFITPCTAVSPANTSRPFLAPSLIRTLPSESFSMSITITGSMLGATVDLEGW
jgi:hypothetical protein